MKKRVILALILMFATAFPIGCYDAREPDDLAYVVALGLDKGRTNKLRMTFQLAVAKNIGGGGQGGGGGGGEEPISVISVEAPSIYSALNMVNTYLSRQITLSHAKVLVFSEELAREGIDLYLNAIARGREFRPNMYMAVSRGTAEDYFRNVKPQLEVNPAKYYELTYRGYLFTAFNPGTVLHEFYTQMKSLGGEPTATLVAVSRFKSSSDFDLKGSTYKEKGYEHPFEGNFLAGEVTKTGGVKAELMGTAVFAGGKMVGKLDGEDTTFHLMTNGDFSTSYVTIPDPKEKEKVVVLDIKQSRRPEHRVTMEEDAPRIYNKLILEADILSVQSGVNYEDVNNIEILEKAAEDFIKKGTVRYLEKTRDEFKADICAFGEHMRSKFLTWKEWENFMWSEHYPDAAFDVEVDLKIRRPGLILYTSPATGSMEGEDK